MANVILAGSTGLTGGLAAEMIAAAGHKLYLIGRKAAADVPDGVTQIVAPIDTWPAEIAKLKIDVAVSCLGSTIKKAGSKEAFRKIDVELVSDFASAAQQSGAKQMLSVSSATADGSASNFYLKMKGEAEDNLRALNFTRLDLIRPGLLLGDRQEFRLGERISIALSPILKWLMVGGLAKFGPIEASDVARAMTSLIGDAGEGVSILHNPEITAAAQK